MNCATCGASNDPGTKFCVSCGTRLAVACANCGSPLKPEAKFCGECGTATALPAGGPVAETGPPTAAAPAPIAERRLVTVLFADLVGFTPFAEERDAEDVRETLSRYFDVARDVVTRYGGTVEKFIGDAVMAVWGTPTAHEDDAERAVRASLELVDAVRTIAPGVEARAGILTGEAVVTLGATNEGMVAGDLVNTASRLQSVAEPGTVLVDEPTHRAASKAVAFEPAGEQMLKGKAAPVGAWRALRVVAEVGGRNRTERLEAPFVGREDELRILKDMLHATTRERRARLISITGMAGIGKSRLAWEFDKYSDGVVETVRWHAGRSPAYGDGVTFWALGEMVRSRAGLAETDDQETTRAKVAATAAEWTPDEEERRWVEVALLALLGAGESPPGGRDALFGAWRTFFEHIAENDTVVMLFEDLQWADMGLLDFIDHLLEWSRDYPIYIVTLARPELLERRPDWGAGKRNFTAIGLDPMPKATMHQLLAGLVPGLPQPAADVIVDRSEGIPLYAVETVRMLVGAGRLVEADGRYQVVGDLDVFAVPETLHALIAARLDTLEPAERALLQDAAVLGQSFTPTGVAAVRSVERGAIEPILRSLTRKEMLSHKLDPRSPERGQYSFVQALIREVAYNTLAKPDRKARHLAAARWFESLGEEELAGALAAHYLAAYQNAPTGPEADALAAQARVALRGAGDRATSLGSYAQSVTFFEQALSVTTDPLDQIDLLVRVTNASTAAGHHDEAVAFGRKAVALARAQADGARTAEAAAVASRAMLNAYRADIAFELLESMSAELAVVADDPSAIAAGGQRARALMFLERAEEALEQADRTLTKAEKADLVGVIADTLSTKGAALCNVGRAYEGIGILRASMALADAHDLTATRFRARANVSGFLSAIDPRGAMEVAKEAIELSERLGWNLTTPILINFMGNAFRTGDWDAAEARGRRALEAPMEPVDWLRAASAMIAFEAARGAPASELEEEYERIAPTVDSTDNAGMVAEMGGLRAVRAGDLVAGHAAFMELAAISALNAPYAYASAARLALWSRDVLSAAGALQRCVATGIHGGAMNVDLDTLRAGVAGLEGRTAEAMTRYRDVVNRWRDLALPWDEAMVGVDLAHTVGAVDAEATAIIERTRSILDGLGANAYLRLLDAALDQGAGAAGQGVPSGRAAHHGDPLMEPTTAGG